MSNIGSYKTRTFSENQKFLVLDPATGTTSLVGGSSLVDYLRPSLNSVQAETTTQAALNQDYDVGEVVQTTGDASPGDGDPGLFLVVAAGTGGVPMLNGNELLVLAGANTALGISYDGTTSGYSATNVQEAIDNFSFNTATNGSDLVAHTGTSDTVTEALNNRLIRVSSRTEMKAYDVPAGYQFSLEEGGRSGLFVVKVGTPPADTQEGIYVVLANGNYAMRRYDGISAASEAKLEWFGVLPDGSTDNTTKIQAAIDYFSGPVKLLLPEGICKITDTILLKNSGVKIVGSGYSVSEVQYVNASGGIAFSGDSSKALSLNNYLYCALEQFSITYVSSATDPDICVDLTSFSYSHFDLRLQSTRPNAKLYYGQGNNGASPYYNHIEGYLFGGLTPAEYTQTGIEFAQGLWSGGSNGPNANVIGPFPRCAGLGTLVDLKSGTGNMFSRMSGESINDYYFKLNDNPAIDSGTSSGSNTSLSFKDTSKTWTSNEYLSDAIKITGGTGAGQVRHISINSADTLTLKEPWGILPDATSTYEIYERRAYGNSFYQNRAEGLASLNPDFIYAAPGTDKTKFSASEVQSLGSGLFSRDESGTTSNSWYSEARIYQTENITNPGPSANIDLYNRVSVFGGARVPGDFIVEWIKVSTTSNTLGDTLTGTLDVGGTGTGTGSVTIVAELQDGNNTATGLPASDKKIRKSGGSNGIYVNVQTGPSFSATTDATVQWCVTLD